MNKNARWNSEIYRLGWFRRVTFFLLRYCEFRTCALRKLSFCSWTMPEGRRNIFVNRSICANCATKFFSSLLVVGDRFFRSCSEGWIGNHFSLFNLLFGRIRIAAKSACYLNHVSVCPSACVNPVCTGNFFCVCEILWNIRDVFKICRQNPDLVKIGRKYLAVNIVTPTASSTSSARYFFLSDFSEIRIFSTDFNKNLLTQNFQIWISRVYFLICIALFI
jgi:hypothetical protein